jgi:signal transduction histidine kinase
MSPPAGITTGLAFLPNLLGEANDAATLESLLSGWLRASGWRTAGVIGPADGRESLMLQVRTDGVGMLPAAPSELNDVMRALKSGTPTVVWQLPNSSGRLYTTFQPVGRAAGMIWAERGAGEPWTEADRNYLVLSTKLIERSPALAARIGPPLEPARLQQRLDDVAGIAGRMAHDFNNMLTGIIGYADLSLPLVPAGSQAAKYIAEISKAGHRGIAFTAQVHSYSRSGQTKPQPSSLPAALLKEEQRLRTKTPKPTLAMDLPANLAQVGVEAGQLGVALGHLLDNAIEAGRTEPCGFQPQPWSFRSRMRRVTSVPSGRERTSKSRSEIAVRGSSPRCSPSSSRNRSSRPRPGTAGWDWPPFTGSCTPTRAASASNPRTPRRPARSSASSFRPPPRDRAQWRLHPARQASPPFEVESP